MVIGGNEVMFRYKHAVKVTQRPDGLLHAEVKYDTRSLEQKLLHILPRYWRWLMEGMPPFQHPVSLEGGRGYGLAPQYYYDPYHTMIEWVPPERPADFDPRPQSFTSKNLHDVGKGHYRFNIQTSDSPSGDGWIKGMFRFVPHGDIEIIEQRAYEN